MKLKRDFYLRATKIVARQLVGKKLVVDGEEGKKKYTIVETEAYLGINDRACHSFGGRRTARTEAMYQMGGTSYVYFIYGMYYCFNVVTRHTEIPEAVLIRGLYEEGDSDPRRLRGPGKLCKVLGIGRHDNQIDLTRGGRLWIEGDRLAPSIPIIVTPRIGVESYGSAAKLKLRYCWKGHPAVKIGS